MNSNLILNEAFWSHEMHNELNYKTYTVYVEYAKNIIFKAVVVNETCHIQRMLSKPTGNVGPG